MLKLCLHYFKEVLLKFQLYISNCQGQCYNGVANVSGHVSGLQKIINDIESHASFVYDIAYTLKFKH